MPGSGEGNAGVVDIRAGTLMLTDGAIISTSSTTGGKGNAGRLTIDADILSLSNGAIIRSQAFRSGDAGDVVITGDRVLIDNSTVTTASDEGAGGNISIVAHERLQLRQGTLSASVQGGPETQGGNVTVDAQLIVLQDSQIIARAIEGNGGQIRLQSDGLISNIASSISASSDVGLDGEVEIETLLPFSNTVALLKQRFEPIPLLAACADRSTDERDSTFVVSQRDSVPADPSWVLPSLRYREFRVPVQGRQSAPFQDGMGRGGLSCAQ